MLYFLCSDWTEEVQIKQTVDAWINTLTKDIQVSSGGFTHLLEHPRNTWNHS